MAGPYDIGGNSQPLSPNFSNFQVLPSAPPSAFTGRSYFDTTLGIGVWANGQWNYSSGGGGTVSSVFSRTGDITAQSNDYTFAQIGSKPTTTSGYGITDAVSLTGGQTLTNKTISGASNTFSNIPESAVTNLTTDLASKQSTYTYYGSLYNKSTFANTSDFTTNGATASISGSSISVSGGTSIGDLTHTLDYTYDTQLDNWVVETTFTVPTITATSFGLGIGMRSSNSFYGASLQGLIDLSSGVNAGKIGFSGGTVASLTFASTLSTTALVFTAGDTIYLRMERRGGIVTLNAKNYTNAASVPLQIEYSFDSSLSTNPQLPNTGRFAVFSNGDAVLMKSLKIFSNTQKGADYAIVGDSKSIGFSANSYSSSWAGQLASYVNLVNLSGSGDRIVDVQRRQAEVIALAPKTVILNIGRNDIGSNSCTLNGTIQTNLQNLVTALQGAGITVTILQPFYETACSMTTFNTFLTTTYPTLLIDTFTPTSSLGTLGIAADGIHPNQTSHDLIFNTIKTSGKVNGRYENANFATVNSSAKATYIPFYNSNNELSFSSNLTYVVSTNSALIAGMSVTPSFTQYTNISLNGSSASGNINIFSGTTDTNLYISRPSGKDIVIRENNTGQAAIFKSGGKVCLGSAAPTAWLHIFNANSTTAGTAPLKFSSGGVLMTTTEPMSVEVTNTHIYWTDNSGNRLQLDQQIGALIRYQHTIFTPSTGGTVALVSGQYNIINPAGTLAALTVNLPSTPTNNDAVYIKYTQAITTVTYGNGTVVDGLTTPTAGGLVVLTYDSGTTSWY